MATPNRGMGHPIPLTGRGGNTSMATAVPLDLLNYGFLPIPATIGGSNNVTFTLKGSTRPIPLWNGNDFLLLDEDLAYTWGAVSNAILDSNGAAATDTDSVLGVWYMYVSIGEDGIPVIKPSQTAPTGAQGNQYTRALLSHPGTSAAQFWTYCGVMWCTTAATPAFLAAEKIGYWWHFAALAATPTSALAVTSVFTVRIPKLSKYGGLVGVNLVTGKAGTVTVGGTSTADRGVAVAKHAGTASGILTAPAILPADDATGELYVIAVVPTGSSVSLTKWRDVV